VWKKFRFYEIIYNNKIIWEEDIAEDRTGQKTWSSNDVTDILKGKKNAKIISLILNKKSLITFGMLKQRKIKK